MDKHRIFQVLVFIISLTANIQGNIVDIGELSRQSTAEPKKIDIVSGNPEISILARRAFAIHGAYALSTKPSGNAHTFRLDLVNQISSPTQEAEVRVTIESGDSGEKPLFEEIIKGKTWQEATLKACDTAVRKTTETPGFFSGMLAFVGERNGNKEIYASDLFFQNPKQLTHDRSKVLSPKWSPDGHNILYTSYHESHFPDIFMIDVKTKKRTTIANYRGTNTGGVFNPTGDCIAMVLSSSGNTELYIAKFISEKGKWFPERLTHNKSLEASPCWTQDNNKILFTSDRLGGPQIYEMNINDQKVRRIPTNISRYCAEPVVNPLNPKLIAFTAAIEKTFQVVLYDTEREESCPLTKGPDDYIEPFWTNDGRHLIITHRIGTRNELCLIDTETGKLTVLHTDAFGYASMASFLYPKSI